MAKSKEQKRKQKRKARLKERQTRKVQENQQEKFGFLTDEARWFARRNPEKALGLIRRALRLVPDDQDALQLLGYLGEQLNNPAAELQALARLYEQAELSAEKMARYSRLLIDRDRFADAVTVAERAMEKARELPARRKKQLLNSLEGMRNYARHRRDLKSWSGPDIAKKGRESQPRKTEPAPDASKPAPTPSVAENAPDPVQVQTPRPEVDIPVSVHIDTRGLETTFAEGVQTTEERYRLALEAYQVRLNETFDRLICLSGLQNVESLWYQEETARKVLKRFRGRALLADEVGLGKTIEALLVFSEYYHRGMIENGLILTPTPLVSQWRQEMTSKFGLDVPTTDDPDFKSKGEAFWEAPFIVASINLAKSKKNFDVVTAREWDMVIVDEAHHLKNRTTLNWKLVNALKKKYLLLLSATPVENNLMELYNLITLLKPGQLKTASAFKEEFMTRGDPTGPRNRERLRSLLDEVMIRNTRAVARVDLPPRFAHTLRVDPTDEERALYEGIDALIREMAKTRGVSRMLLKNLLAEAGSSPRAVLLTLQRRMEKGDLPQKKEKQFQSVLKLCDGIGKTRKNRMLLNLLAANPGKLIIFVKYLGTLEYVSGFLKENGLDHCLFHGSMGNAEKDAQVERFRADADILLTTEIGGEGRNLQFCNQMINYDLPWNPMKIEQRIGRIHRIGQEREVTIYNFCGAGSIEDYILDILDRKINMFEMVIGEIDMILGRIRGEQEFSDLVYEIWMGGESEEERQAGFDRLATRLKRSKTSYVKTRELDDKLFEDGYEI